MLLAIDTSTAACTAALFDEAGACLASRCDVIGRGHAERLVPMIEELMAGRRAARILVGVGPGSFTGIRVGIAAAQGLAIGWGSDIGGMSSLALLAAGAGAEEPVAAAVDGGHGELFVQVFDGRTLAPISEMMNLSPAAASEAVTAGTVIGPGAKKLVDARGHGRAVDGWPRAEFSVRLPEALRSLAPRPLYGRAPDAKAKAA
ncbi:MAG TPA: tRNA (adenosine(37)-N6)-threonylcarbamoyltransferase complex dimerization subunit type 1 TsaB [Sphingomicrobium sp.]